MIAPMLIAALHTALLTTDAASAAPEWVHLVPAGEFRGVDGRGPYRLRDAARVIEASMTAGRLPIDENHATDHAMKEGGAAPARGWIIEMQARDDGIWGRVEWTAAGQQLLGDKAYRGISPVFAHTDKGGEVVQLLRAALTNAPNLAQLKTLHTQQESNVDLAKLRAALGLADTADEAAIIAAAAAARTAVTAHTQQVTAIAKAAGLADDAKPEVIVTALQTRAAAGNPDDLAKQVVALQTQLTTVQQERAKEKATAAVDAAIKAGKPIPTTLRDHYIARHMQDPVAVETELAGLPSLHTGGVTRPPAGGDAAVTDPEEARVIALLGVDPKIYAEQKKQLGLTVEAG